MHIYFSPLTSSQAICRLRLCANTLEVIASGFHRNQASHDQVLQQDWLELRSGQTSRTGPGSYEANGEGEPVYSDKKLRCISNFKYHSQAQPYPSDEHHHLHSECRPASQKWYDLVLQVAQPTAQSGIDAQGSLQTAEIVDDSRSHWELQLCSGVEWYWYDGVFTLWALSSLTSTTEEGQELFESELQD